MVGYKADGPLRVVFGLSRGLCGRSSYDFGAPVGYLGPPSGPVWAGLGCFRGYVGGLGPLLGPLLVVMGRSQGLCRQAWPLLEPLLAVLGRLGLKNAEEYAYL